MGIMRKLEKLQRLDQLIRLQCTGTSAELARKLEISQSTLYELFSLAKKLGAQITYNNCSCTYEYERPMKFVVGFGVDRCTVCKKAAPLGNRVLPVTNLSVSGGQFTWEKNRVL